MAIDRLTDADFKKHIVQYTNEPYEVVEARIEARLGTPEIRQLVANRYKELFYACEEHDPLRVYKASADLGSVMAFGKNYQEVDLRFPPIIDEKEQALLTSLRMAHDSLALEDIETTRQNLAAIPFADGSACDRGEFDGYHHEVLLMVSNTAFAMRQLLPVNETDLRAKQRISACIRLAPEVISVIDGLEQNNRIAIIFAFSEISNQHERLLKPETLLEKAFKQLRTRLSKAPTHNLTFS